VAGGLLAGVVVGQLEKYTERLVSEKQKRREKEVREDSAHKMAGPYFGKKILGRDLSESEARKSRIVFGVTYGVMWGLIYAGLRRKYPFLSKYMGFPFAVPFFFGCDGGMAPLLGVSPGIEKLPWQINAKEMGNHIAWTFAAEAVHRLSARSSGSRAGGSLTRAAAPGAAEKKSERLQRELPAWLSGMLIAGTVASLLYLEEKRPLRKPRQDKLHRNIRNFSMSATTALTVRLTEKPLADFLMKEAEKRGFGLLNRIRVPAWLELALSVVLLDYTLYIWHYLTHKVPLLWRLHEVHHVDLDLDASTALRFHPVEMLLSAPWRGAQVFFLGVSPLGLSLWQTLTLLAIMWHHSNVELLIDLERKLSRVIVTQRMHGIHHSIVHEETDSNWSTIFSWPDYLHDTLRLNVPQEEITIGVPGYQHAEELTLGRIFKMPVIADKPSWRLRNGRTPERGREELPDSRALLMA
jgi:sterol desaturase/sphingolipid hydroxylase (fatty acid hydroxylase superfamily)